MFQFLTFDFSSVLIGLLVALVGGLLMYMSVLLANKQHTPLSLCVVALFSIIVFVMGVCFVGLCEAKGALQDVQNSSEYQLRQKGEDLLEQYSPKLAGLVSDVLSPLSEGISEEYIAYQCRKISKYQWLTGTFGLLIMVLGMIASYLTAGAPRSAGSGRRGDRSHRGGETRVSRSHRSHY